MELPFPLLWTMAGLMLMPPPGESTAQLRKDIYGLRCNFAVGPPLHNFTHLAFPARHFGYMNSPDVTCILYLDVQGTLIQFVGLMEKPMQMSVCFVCRTENTTRKYKLLIRLHVHEISFQEENTCNRHRS
ncbi:Thymidylate kinase [Varanus komodoensis]|nr:Thymidylate kinase [Varanus komodoensis]